MERYLRLDGRDAGTQQDGMLYPETRLTMIGGRVLVGRGLRMPHWNK